MADGPISNQDYDIISVVYHAAQGAETLRKSMGASQQGGGGGGGQQGASALFQQALQQYEQIAQRGLQLLRGGQSS